MVLPLRSVALFRPTKRYGLPHLLFLSFISPKPQCLSNYKSIRHIGGYGGPPIPGQIGPQNEDVADTTQSEKARQPSNWSGTLFKMFESAATTIVSLMVLGMAGYGYHRYYKYLILKKMKRAFDPGDPVLEMAATGSEVSTIPEGDNHWMRLLDQERINAIVDGTEKGHYHLLIGEKGTGKSSMLLNAMQKVNGEGISMFEAHADLEIFRIRLGKALDFEYSEDYIGSLFSIRGPRETTALLDIERALNKLEKVALQRRKTVGRPLVLIVNSMHLLRDDEDGRDLLELIQQRAEQWAASNLITLVLNSDDYWVYERLKQYSTRMEVFPVLDLARSQAITALRQSRKRYYKEEPPPEILAQVYEKVGGRLSFLHRVAKAQDMLRTCDEICQAEKTWFLNKCWILGSEMDDDVMDQQKYASAAMVLAKALVDKEQESGGGYDPQHGHRLAQIPLHEAREIMTRADFIQSYDHINIFTIDSQAMVRADSVPMMRAFRQICSREGFDKHLEATLDRISAIESLGRTREIVAKDLVSGKYRITGRSDCREGLVVEVLSSD